MTLQGSVAFAFYRNAVVLDVGLSALAGAQDDVDGVRSAFGISPSSNFSSFPTSMILKPFCMR